MSSKPPILHILVVGFHHKLGCQVEFSYPALIPGAGATGPGGGATGPGAGGTECPSGWKYLPTLALPDGSHNFTEDTVFFNLPSILEPTESVFGVSCYRQIPVEKLKIRTADVTRSTVQKSVCILTRLPIYGYIEVKLALIADAYFDQGDFACTEILVKSYQQLNACLFDEAEVRRQRQYYVGISLREIVLHWRHKMLILFKLFLLQKRVVCFGSPVRRMCVLILGVASLIPRLLEKGFQEVACVRTSRPLSPMPDFTDCLQREAEALKQEKQRQISAAANISDTATYNPECIGDIVKNEDELKEHHNDINDINTVGSASGDISTETTATLHDSIKAEQLKDLRRKESTESCSSAGTAEALNRRSERSDSLTREGSIDALISTLGHLSTVSPDEYRAPISIFASGNLCLPYLSLPYMDLLSDPSVLSYIIGTSNVLFQQKRQLADVLVDIENSNLDVYDPELRRQLVLSTEDLRFMDFILKHVQMPKEDAEGSENWIREQFQGYILALLRTAVVNDTTTKENEHFNGNFMNAFKHTQCFQEWFDVRPDAEFFDVLPAGHPFAGTLSVADMKLKIAQTMQNSESGRKINQAVNNTSRAVGGAITQAKGAFSNWWSSITAVPAQAATSTENVDNNSTTSKSSPSQAQDISVTFQNGNNECNIGMGVTINIEEPTETILKTSTSAITQPFKSTNLSRNTSSASSAGGCSEKLVDSAEELEEDSINSLQKAPSDAEEATTQALDNVTSTSSKGVVEIGREAGVLDKNNILAAATSTNVTQHSNNCETDTIFPKEINNDGIFIV